MQFNTQQRREILTLIVVFAGVLLISALTVYVVGGGSSSGNSQSQVTESETAQNAPPPQATGKETIIDRLFGSSANETFVTSERWAVNLGRLSLRLLLAALLGAALAFRPRKKILSLKRNPYVAQTQILLAIVAAALMIIVGDNAARAFGIFAAVSLVRFRTNIRDPKEITVLLISLALGLAAGVGRWDLAVALAFFTLIVLWLLEWHELQQILRSMEVTVTTRDILATQQALQTVFKKHGFDVELRTLDRDVSDDSPGKLEFAVEISPVVTTDDLSAEILRIDGHNVEGIEWNQKKSYSYLYR